MNTNTNMDIHTNIRFKNHIATHVHTNTTNCSYFEQFANFENLIFEHFEKLEIMKTNNNLKSLKNMIC